jgi:hypothetical protein
MPTNLAIDDRLLERPFVNISVDTPVWSLALRLEERTGQFLPP